MFSARDANTGRLVAAQPDRLDAFHAAVQGSPSEPDLRCPDPGCEARVHFVSEALCQGGLYERRPHFATYPGERHQPGCIAARFENFMRAAKGQMDEYKLIINLNIPALHRSNKRPEKNERPRGDCLSFSVKNASEYMGVRARLLDAGAGKNAMYVCYKGHYMPLCTFELGGQKDRAALHAGLKAKQEKMRPPGPVCDTLMPRMIFMRGDIAAQTSHSGKTSLHDRALLETDWSAVTTEICSGGGASIDWRHILQQSRETLPALAVMAFPYIRRGANGERNIVWPVTDIACLALPVATDGPSQRFVIPEAHVAPPAPLAFPAQRDDEPSLFAG